MILHLENVKLFKKFLADMDTLTICHLTTLTASETEELDKLFDMWYKEIKMIDQEYIETHPEEFKEAELGLPFCFYNGCWNECGKCKEEHND